MFERLAVLNFIKLTIGGLILTYVYDRYVKGLVKALLDPLFRRLEQFGKAYVVVFTTILVGICLSMIVTPVVYFSETVYDFGPSARTRPTASVIVLPPAPTTQLSSTELFVLSTQSGSPNSDFSTRPSSPDPQLRSALPAARHPQVPSVGAKGVATAPGGVRGLPAQPITTPRATSQPVPPITSLNPNVLSNPSVNSYPAIGNSLAVPSTSSVFTLPNASIVAPQAGSLSPGFNVAIPHR